MSLIKKNKGFALVEMLAVAGIMAILFCIFLGGLWLYQPRVRLSSAIRDLLTDVRYAQQLSVAFLEPFGISFLTVENKYQLLKFSATTTQQIFEKSLPQGVSFQDVSGFLDNEVRFNSYGAVNYGGIVLLVNSDGAIKGIDIGPSGFAKIF